MIGRDLPDLENREDLKREAVNAIATINYTFHQTVDTMKNSEVYAKQKTINVIKDVQGETEGVKMYVKPPKIFQRKLINL